MIDLEKACAIFKEHFPDQTIDSILDVGDEWVLSGRNAKTSLKLDISPIAVAKADGKVRTFFPPANMSKLKNAIRVERK